MKKLWWIIAGIVVLFVVGCFFAAAAAEGAVSLLIHGGLVVCAVVTYAKEAYENEKRGKRCAKIYGPKTDDSISYLLTENNTDSQEIS